jgi:hypothetical protein
MHETSTISREEDNDENGNFPLHSGGGQLGIMSLQHGILSRKPRTKSNQTKIQEDFKGRLR